MGGGSYNDTPDTVEVKSQSTVPMWGTFHLPQKVKTFRGPVIRVFLPNQQKIENFTYYYKNKEVSLESDKLYKTNLYITGNF